LLDNINTAFEHHDQVIGAVTIGEEHVCGGHCLLRPVSA
jgi:hypothetical protein